MKQVRTKGIVLARTNFGEADRILTFLTPDHGKVKAIAKAVRKQKSKLAGGIELFSISDISYVIGRGEISTLTSTRLIKYFGNIVKDLDRTQLGYELIRLTNKVTEDQPEPEYFMILQRAFEALDDDQIDPGLITLWFNMQLLKLAGHTPNLKTDVSGKKLSEDKKYYFELERMRFRTSPDRPGEFEATHIKFLRLGFSAERPHLLQRVEDAEGLAAPINPLVQTMLAAHIRI